MSNTCISYPTFSGTPGYASVRRAARSALAGRGGGCEPVGRPNTALREALHALTEADDDGVGFLVRADQIGKAIPAQSRRDDGAQVTKTDRA